MSTRAISRAAAFPSVFENFFKPFNDIFNGNVMPRMARVPAVNVMENDNAFTVSLAAPGLK